LDQCNRNDHQKRFQAREQRLEPRREDELMIDKSVGWTAGGSPGTRDPGEPDINKLGPDEVVVRINGRQANRTRDNSGDGDHAAQVPQDVCHGIRGLVVEAGANALWYVDRAVIVPAADTCGNCNADRRDKVIASDDDDATGIDDDALPAKFVVMQAQRLCVVSVNAYWRKPMLT
jgi:threonine dehydrogenase-like Zn-dependent dehydrogenase